MTDDPNDRKGWEQVTDAEIIAAVHLAQRHDPDYVARSPEYVLAVLIAPRADQWPGGPPPHHARLGLGLMPSHGKGSATARQVGDRIRKLANRGHLKRVGKVTPTGKPTVPGYRMVHSATP